MFGDELLASAAMDRLMHYATTIEITVVGRRGGAGLGDLRARVGRGGALGAGDPGGALDLGAGALGAAGVRAGPAARGLEGPDLAFSLPWEVVPGAQAEPHALIVDLTAERQLALALRGAEVREVEAAVKAIALGAHPA